MFENDEDWIGGRRVQAVPAFLLRLYLIKRQRNKDVLKNSL